MYDVKLKDVGQCWLIHATCRCVSAHRSSLHSLSLTQNRSKNVAAVFEKVMSIVSDFFKRYTSNELTRFLDGVLQFTSVQVLPVSRSCNLTANCSSHISSLPSTRFWVFFQADADILSCFVFVVNSSTTLSISTCSRRSMCVLTHHVGDYSVCRSNCFVMQNTTQVHTQSMFYRSMLNHFFCNKRWCTIVILTTAFCLWFVDQRDYICEFCARAFKSSHNLAVHRMIHTGEKPLQ